jgi:hypothetical protein
MSPAKVRQQRVAQALLRRLGRFEADWQGFDGMKAYPMNPSGSMAGAGNAEARKFLPLGPSRCCSLGKCGSSIVSKRQ